VNHSTQYSYLRLASTLGGLGLVGVAAFLNVSHAAVTEGSYFSPVCIAIVALAFGSALAVPVMLTLWRSGRRGLALVALLGLVCSESYGFQLSAERLLASRAQRAQQVRTAGSPYALAREALDLAISERKAECASGRKRKCLDLEAVEDAKRTALGLIPVPTSHVLIADATGLPEWLVEIIPAMSFSTGLLVLGFVLVGFGAHGSVANHTEQTVVTPAVLEPIPDERERVVSWIKAFERRHGRRPMIPEVQQVFDLPKTTAWRRLKSS
jgi:hypothetical protein